MQMFVLLNTDMYDANVVYVLVILCLHEIELLLDAIAALQNGEFERRVGLLWWALCV